MAGKHPGRASAGWPSGRGGGDGLGFPVPGQEVGVAAGRVIGDAGERVFDPCLDHMSA